MTDRSVELRKNSSAVKMLHQRAKGALSRSCRVARRGYSADGEPLGDLLAALVDARLHGAERHVQLVGDLGIAHRTEIAQYQRLDQLRVVQLELVERLQQVEPRAGNHRGG